MVSIRSDDIRGRWGRLIDNTASFTNLDLSGQTSGIIAVISGQVLTSGQVLISGQVSGFAISPTTVNAGSATFSQVIVQSGLTVQQISGSNLNLQSGLIAQQISGANINISGMIFGTGSGQTLNLQSGIIAGAVTISGIILFNGITTIGAGASGISFSGLQMMPTMGPGQVIVWVSGTNVNSGTYRAMYTNNGQIFASGTEAVIVIDAAISGAGINGSVWVKPGQYIFNSGLNLVNRSFHLIGESWRFIAPPSSLSGNTIFKKNFSGGVLLDMVNSSGTTSDQKIEKLIVTGDDTGTGIDWFFTGGNYGVKLRDVFIQDFDIGLRLRRSTYIEMDHVMVNSCPTYGIYLDSSGASAAFNNTLAFFGGFSLNCGHNVFATRTNDVQLYSMKLEGYSSGGIYITSAGNAVTLVSCSLEVNGASGLVAVEDWGNNNAVISCRFDSNVEYTAFALRSGCRNFRAMGNFFQFNASGVICHIIGTSGACSGSMFEGNTKGTNTPGTVDWQFSGCSITSIGNSDMYDTTTNMSGWIYVGPVIHSGSATFAGPVTISGTTNLQAVSGFNWRGVFTSGGVSGGSGASYSGMIPQGYINLQVSGNTVRVPFFN